MLSLPLPRTTDPDPPTFTTCPLAPQILIYSAYIALLGLTLLFSFVHMRWKPRRNEYVSLPLWRLDGESPREEDGPGRRRRQRLLGWLSQRLWIHFPPVSQALKDFGETVSVALLFYAVCLLVIF